MGNLSEQEMKLKTKYKYIKFIKAKKQNPKTAIYLVRTNDYHRTLLGQIRYYAHWRQYGFYPEREYQTVFEKTCLTDIADFCINLNKLQRSKK